MNEPAKGVLLEQRLAEAAKAAAVGAPEPPSLAQRLAHLPSARAEILAEVRPRDASRLLHDWQFWARPTQLGPPGHWLIWLILAGRGWGKTRTGGEFVKDEVDRGLVECVGLVGPSLNDVWQTMVFGTPDAPGIELLYAHLPKHARPVVNRQDRVIRFANGAIAKIYTAEEPEIRGPNTGLWWCDELAKWKYLQACWDNIEMTNRAVGKRPPRIVVTTTPRPLQIIKDLLDDPDVHVTFGSTFANSANLAKTFLKRMQKRFQGTRLGKQELFGLVLGDNPDGMFNMSAIDRARVMVAPPLKRIVVAVDNAIATSRRNDLTGIIVEGLGYDDELYPLADYTGCAFDREAKGLRVWLPEEPIRHKPEEWGELVVRAYLYHQANEVVVERNRGGDLVASNIRAALIARRMPASAIKIVEVHAARGKDIRAEPISTMYEQGKVHHVGELPALETEITEWNPKLQPESPNRLDALVWGAYALMGFGAEPPPDTRSGFEGIVEANARYTIPHYDAGC